MNIDLGYLGKVVLEEIEAHPVKDWFTVVMDGYTESGIRVHGVIDNREFAETHYPMVWQNAILIKL